MHLIRKQRVNPMKLEEIESVLCTTGKFDIICMSETWLCSKTSDDEIKIENYTLYRRDQDSDCGYGGVCIYVSNSLKSKRNLTYQSDGIELIWIEIQIEKLNILIGSCYRPPNQPADEKHIFLTKLQDSIKLTL